ncbi:hypothetical protein ATK36_4506 [Amycolatopsis sulphurea]|uniref:Uncharacterized protein n=1 Tax=Amycolatopsis sulphurea TaxID=76022 RepID=A0A2A9FG01_9PSEU|nr:hypothetical protein ATK36_4506 [Amycolatopsis sulphurea]
MKGSFTDSESVKDPFTDLYTDFADTLDAQAVKGPFTACAGRRGLGSGAGGEPGSGVGGSPAGRETGALWRGAGRAQFTQVTPPAVIGGGAGAGEGVCAGAR